MKITDIFESTTSGSVASVAMPLGGTQKREGSLFKGKKTKKKFYEGKVKELMQDLKDLSDEEFKKKYKKTKQEWRQALKEDEVNEADLILVPGHGNKLKPGFIPKDKDRTDHEVEMARSDLYNAAKNAQAVYKMIENISEEQGLEGWVQEKIIKANDYLNTIREYLEHKTYMQEELMGGVIAGGQVQEDDDKRCPQCGMIGCKCPPGKCNCKPVEGWTPKKVDEQQLDELSPELKARYRLAAKQDKRFNQRGIDQALDRAERDQAPGRAEWEDEAEFFKSVNAKRDRGLRRAGDDEVQQEGKVTVRYEPDIGATPAARPSKIANSRNAIEKYLRNRYGKGEVTIEDYKEYHKPYTYIATHTSKRGDTNSHLIIPDKNGKYGIETMPLSTSGDYPEVYEDKQIDEKKDACYSKVKSRYKVWPSAYASGALVKCRKVGASNWGNKSKK